MRVIVRAVTVYKISQPQTEVKLKNIRLICPHKTPHNEFNKNPLHIIGVDEGRILTFFQVFSEFFSKNGSKGVV